MGLIFELVFYDLLFILVSLLAVAWVLGQSRYKFFEKQGIPFAKPIFPLGSSWSTMLLRESFGDSFAGIYRQGEGSPIIGAFLVFNPAYVIRDPALIQQISTKDFSYFQDHGLPIDEEVNPLEGHLFNVGGAKWRALRYKLSPTFTSGKLKWMFTIMEQVSDNLVKQVAKEAGSEIESRDLLCRYTTDVIASCAFGIEAGALENPECEIRKLGRKIFHPPWYWLIKQLFRFTFPTAAVWLRMKNTPDDIDEFFFSLMQQAFTHRIQSGAKRTDFIQLLMELKEKGEVKLEPKEMNDQDDEYLKQPEVKAEEIEKLTITDAVLAAQTFVFFLAGFETSASAMNFTLYHLAIHPETQSKLRDEVREVKNKHGGITYNALKEMHYLHSCIMESLRLYPPVPVLSRACNKAYVFPDGTKISPGYGVVFPARGLHQDPQYFPEPEKFKPERFMPGQHIVPGSFLPFGDGPRICIGQRFALLEMKLGLAKLVDNFEITKSPKLKIPLTIDVKSFITMPKEGVYVIFKKLQRSVQETEL